jgi:transcriptional regulator with XRE-family HTH domain
MQTFCKLFLNYFFTFDSTHQQPIMTFQQNSVTKKFIKTVNYIIDKGQAKSFADVAEKLEWNRTSMSNVYNGRINVPLEVYKKLAKVFHVEVEAEVSAREYVANKVAKIEAISEVNLLVLAELLAAARNQPIAKVLADLKAAVNRQAESSLNKEL